MEHVSQANLGTGRRSRGLMCASWPNGGNPEPEFSQLIPQSDAVKAPHLSEQTLKCFGQNPCTCFVQTA